MDVVVETHVPPPPPQQSSSIVWAVLLVALIVGGIALLGYSDTDMGATMRGLLDGDLGVAQAQSALDAALVPAPAADPVPARPPGPQEPGWCYVGEQKGMRSCIRVGENDYCQSGSVYPTQAVCVEPTLRA